MLKRLAIQTCQRDCIPFQYLVVVKLQEMCLDSNRRQTIDCL